MVYRRNTWSCNWPFDTPLCTFKWGGHPTCMAFDPGCEFLATGCDVSNADTTPGHSPEHPAYRP